MMEKNKRVMDMRLPSTRGLSGRGLQLRGLRLVATLLACFVLPCLFLVALQPNMGGALSVLTLQSTRTSLHIQVVEAEISGSSHRPVAETRILVKEEEKESQRNIPSSAAERVNEETSPPVEETKSMESSQSANVIISSPVKENKSLEDNHTTDAEGIKLTAPNQETEGAELNSSTHHGEPIADTELKSSTLKQEGTNSSTPQEGTKLPISDQETENQAVADTTETTISSTPQEGMKLSVSSQETGIEEKNTIIFGEINADTTEMNSSVPQEGTEGQNAGLVSVPLVFTKMQSEENLSGAGASGVVVTSEIEVPVEKQDYGNSPVVGTNLHCDFSQERSDTCSAHGDVRIDGRSSTITVASQAQSNPRPGADSLAAKIRPYSRKWEPQLMERIREFSIKTSSNPDEAPRCTANHTAPAVVFSTGGFVGNFFHDFTDVLIPLFITSRQYQGEVHFLVTDFNHGWVSKYSPILSRLSRHAIVNVDDDGANVHCFPQVHVGLLSHKELGMDASKVPNGYSVGDFRELLRSAYSLKRKSVGAIAGRKPRLLIMLRKGSRAFANARQVVSMGRRSGFKVVAAGPEDARELSHFVRVVNSCDVMMGVHGAGLTNMLFLPDGASVVQILPWGGLHYACWHDFGAPAPDMGLNYLEYDIREKESSLAKRYSRDDPVFKDPMSIHKMGFGAIWSVFLKDQTVKLDVRRFRTVLQEALQAVH
ncbi:Uncharacterized protein M6B38_218620 [Iris pallida]|uniref:Glycosyltransferase 61 catalytic domain-containing protein n=1 Tax=Iris pallida TaxID=29817 RepID=A0AAX6DXQ6_IRIPA|nr:Uncharacterized protein M6B38_218620 [Iris pallida]